MARKLTVAGAENLFWEVLISSTGEEGMHKLEQRERVRDREGKNVREK